MYIVVVVSCLAIAAFAIFNAVKSSNATCGVCGKKVGMSGLKIAKSKAMVCNECFNKASAVHKESTGLILNAFQVTIDEIKNLCENGMNGVVGGKYYENGKFVDREHYKKCNICGHIFCFSDSDMRENERLLKKASTARKLAVMESIGGTRLAANQQSGKADSLESQIVDYSKCPKCNSTNLTDLTEEQAKNERASTSNNAKEISSADEIKKFKELLDNGIITQEEFDAKKKQLLGL